MALSDLLNDLCPNGTLPHLEEALTHPSFANEKRGGRPPDNQRLEFLGDAVLGLCVSEHLMTRFPTANEGELSRLRSALVSTGALAEWARAIDLGSSLHLGKGADSAGDRAQKSVLADTVEALVGAVFVDLGLHVAQRLAEIIVHDALARHVEQPSLARDPKSELQERVQADRGVAPRYRVMEAEGPDHSPVFVVAVELEGQLLGIGRGKSKKIAEQEAARAALKSMFEVLEGGE